MKDAVSMAHGGGGRLSGELIKKIFAARFSNEILNRMDDSARLGEPPPGKEILFTTDSFVVRPLFFPGGDIGKLSVCGTVNDLAVSGAGPGFLSAGFIVEEGFEISLLEKIAFSMAQECARAGVSVAAGDFKVVEKGCADGVYINTSGIGFKDRSLRLSREKILPGDKIITNGSLGDHEAAVLLERGDFKMRGNIKSDCASLNNLISEILSFHAAVLDSTGHETVRFMRDPTRGGAAAALNEAVAGMRFGAKVFLGGFPVKDGVDSVCEMLGLDPVNMANEGKVIVFVNSDFAGEVLALMKKHPLGVDSAVAGEVVDSPAGKVLVETVAGGLRILGMPEGGELPRIC